MEYPYTSLNTLFSYIPEADREKVSEVARSDGQFVDQYIQAGGIPENLPPQWRSKRNAFIARHLAQYWTNPTRRRFLALQMWAYDPST